MNARLSTPRPKSSRVRKAGGSLLGLALDGDRLEIVALRRTNGSIEVQRTLRVALSLDPLTNEAALVGREIRKHLDEAGLRERRCIVGLPLAWLLAVRVPLPDLSEEDLAGVLEIEAERGFPYAPETLVIARSIVQAPGGGRHATLAAVPRDHVARLEAALVAAQLRPVSFSLGIMALAGGAADGSEPAWVLTPDRNGIGLLISVGGNVVALRSLQGAYEQQGGGLEIRPENVVRELRITIGQLPPEIASSLRRLHVMGHGEQAEELEEAVRAGAEALGLQVELKHTYRPRDFPVALPSGTQVSPALSLAARYLSGLEPDFEFLPPKVTVWHQITSKYSSRKLVWAGTAAGALALAVLTGFLVQQVQLWYWGSKWAGMQARVAEVETLQQRIRQFRPWFDKSIPTLSLLRCLTEAFPVDGAVSARSLLFREPALVTCTGTARDRQSLLDVLEKLRTANEVSNVKLEQMRGRTPLEFSFNFQWVGQGGS